MVSASNPVRIGGPDRIRVVICEDHALFRRGLMVTLESADDIDVVGEAANGAEAIELVSHVAPDVVLMDVRMPKVDGITAAREILDVLPTATVLMLTVSDDEDDLFEAMKCGAAGYLLKEIGANEIIDAVRAVHDGQRLVTPSLATKLITEFAGAERRRSEEELDTPKLTARELEVLRNVADGATNREIAQRLGISENTVKNHVRNILEKLRLHTRMEAVLYAMRRQLLDPP